MPFVPSPQLQDCSQNFQINANGCTMPGASGSARSANYVRVVENAEIIIKLTPDEALVLSDWLEKVEMTDPSRLVDDEAIWAPIHRLAGTLDSPCLGSSLRTTANV